jgi:hypothetical protein
MIIRPSVHDDSPSVHLELGIRRISDTRVTTIGSNLVFTSIGTKLQQTGLAPPVHPSSGSQGPAAVDSRVTTTGTRYHWYSLPLHDWYNQFLQTGLGPSVHPSSWTRSVDPYTDLSFTAARSSVRHVGGPWRERERDQWGPGARRVDPKASQPGGKCWASVSLPSGAVTRMCCIFRASRA